jgi:hypothetical protein
MCVLAESAIESRTSASDYARRYSRRVPLVGQCRHTGGQAASANRRLCGCGHEFKRSKSRSKLVGYAVASPSLRLYVYLPTSAATLADKPPVPPSRGRTARVDGG